jgi:ATP-dependent helicase HrpB
MNQRLTPLPIDPYLDLLGEHLQRSSAVVLVAPPGSGKTTRVAPWLVRSQLFDPSQRIYLLQPRRVAARATAERIAFEQDWRVGDQVGYQVRFEKTATETTPLVVATEGILLRKLQDDPLLAETSVVILDEFHERSLNADLLLGMLRRIQTTLRDDLKLVIMSATIETDLLTRYFGTVPIMEVAGSLFPVEVKYRPLKSPMSMVEHVTETVLLTCERSEGDMLVFLPGVGEISRIQQALQSNPAMRVRDVLPLHGSLPLEQQNRVLRSSAKPRIVLATNVAETSLTLEGIRVVIDSGQARVLRFDPSVGLDRLQLEPICQASATQRAGRAGRLSAGTCIRLWDESSQRARPAYLEPEIRRVDLSAAILQMYKWGEKANSGFPWLQPPREDAVANAIRLLQRLGALHGENLTGIGEVMAGLPIAPRLARLLIESQRFGHLPVGALVAALLSERDPFLKSRDGAGARGRAGLHTKSQARWDCDVTQKVHALQSYFDGGSYVTSFGEIHRQGAQTIADVGQQLTELVREMLGTAIKANSNPTIHADDAIRLSLLAAYPDRLAKRRSQNDQRALMVGGRGIKLAPSSGVTQPELFLCIDVDGAASEAVVRMACGIEADWLPSDMLEERDELFFHPTQKQVVARRRQLWDDLVLAETPTAIEDLASCSELLFSAASNQWRELMPSKDDSVDSFLARVSCLREWLPELNLPVFDDAAMLEVVKQLCEGRRSFEEIRKAPWLDWLRNRLTQEQLQTLDREAPERVEVPSGSRIRIEYAPGKAPVLAVRIQEVFSWKATPRIARGRVPLLLHLLAPNFRPQQITDDLTSFWNSAYHEVRKELRRRYPKHAWPEDPTTAAPVKKG